MSIPKRKVFISYYHADDQKYKDALCSWNQTAKVFIDKSVNTGGISDSLPDQSIRTIIRDQYLKDSSVTILLAGPNTAGRKHVDWELYSSMYNGAVNKQSGILVINLPESNCTNITAAQGDFEKKHIYSEYSSWMSIDSAADYRRRYPHLSDRIIDNLINKDAKISVTSWDKICENENYLTALIHLTAENRANNSYDLSRAMRRANSPLPSADPFAGLFRQSYQ